MKATPAELTEIARSLVSRYGAIEARAMALKIEGLTETRLRWILLQIDHRSKSNP